MGKYFGTDGFRGKANQNLTVAHALSVGMFLGWYFSQEGKKDILVGKDTRLSSDMFESALAAGISAGGCNAVLCGTCPTPMVAYLVRKHHYVCGAMISASHNPYGDNGIKLFSSQGEKCDPNLEALIEDYIDGKSSIDLKQNDAIGQIKHEPSLLDEYCQWVATTVCIPENNYRVVIDCANGSSSVTALRVLKSLVKEVIAINNEPNGVNINTNCGSTHPNSLQEAVIAYKADAGFAFDGDADRLICVDENGQLVTGDHMLYFLGKALNDQGQLNDQCVVSTVMANLGFFKALQEAGLTSIKTDVGDKYVYEQMIKHSYDLGGEQSGHIIFRRLLTTGDGLLTALHVIEVMAKSQQSLSQLSRPVTIYPQLLVNVKVNDKHAVLEDPQVSQWINESETALNNNGRLLVRASGTEPLVRVMAEAETEEICHTLVNELADKIKNKYGI